MKKSNPKTNLVSNPIEKMAEMLARAEDPNDNSVPNIVMTDLFSEDGESEEMTATEFGKKIDEKLK